MTLRTSLVVLVVSTSSLAQEGQPKPMELRWQVAKGQSLELQTSMEAVEGKDPGFTFDPQGFAGLGDDGPISDEARETIKAIPLPKRQSMITTLAARPDGQLDVTMVMQEIALPEGADEEDAKAAELRKTMQEMTEGVMLRGRVDRTGKPTSFWLEERQENLLALFLQLPSQPVSPGDSWSIDVGFVSMGGDFRCKQGSRTNRVEFVRLETNAAGERVAVLHYVIAEAVEGTFMKDTEQTLGMAFLGEGRFLVDKGHWESLSGVIRMKGTGMMTVDNAQHLVMRVPPK